MKTTCATTTTVPPAHDDCAPGSTRMAASSRGIATWSTSRGTRIGAAPRRRGAPRPTAWWPASRTTLARIWSWISCRGKSRTCGCSSANRDRAWRPGPGARPHTCRTHLRSRRSSTRSRSWPDAMPWSCASSSTATPARCASPGRDPTPYDPDRMAAVLRLAAERGGLGQAPPPGHARGLAAHFTFGSYCAQVVELSVDPSRASRSARAVA